MKVEFDQLPPHARVWVYAADKELSFEQQQKIIADAGVFTDNWTAHQVPLRAGFTIIKNIFLVFGVDTGHHDVSGCGIDKSVHLVQQWERELGLNLFNRMQLEYEKDGKVFIASRQALSGAYDRKEVNENTLFYNKSVLTVEEMNRNFNVPFSKTWVFSQIAKQPA